MCIIESVCPLRHATCQGQRPQLHQRQDQPTASPTAGRGSGTCAAESHPGMHQFQSKTPKLANPPLVGVAVLVQQQGAVPSRHHEHIPVLGQVAGRPQRGVARELRRVGEGRSCCLNMKQQVLWLWGRWRAPAGRAAPAHHNGRWAPLAAIMQEPPQHHGSTAEPAEAQQAHGYHHSEAATRPTLSTRPAKPRLGCCVRASYRHSRDSRQVATNLFIGISRRSNCGRADGQAG